MYLVQNGVTLLIASGETEARNETMSPIVPIRFNNTKTVMTRVFMLLGSKLGLQRGDPALIHKRIAMVQSKGRT